MNSSASQFVTIQQASEADDQSRGGEAACKFIMDVHSAVPGVMERSIGAARTKEGWSSYEAFCNFAKPAPGMRVAELACGNGPLCEIVARHVGENGGVIGVDLNRSELKLAAERLVSFRNVCLLRESADKISLPDGSCDLVLCHMAFMLFSPLQAAVAEIARILKSGAKFAAVIPTLRVPTVLFRACGRVMGSVLQQESHALNVLGRSEVKMESMAELKHIFSVGGQFHHDIQTCDIDAVVTDAPEQLVRRILPGFYQSHLLSRAGRQQVESIWIELFRRHQDSEGLTHFHFPLTAFAVKKR